MSKMKRIVLLILALVCMVAGIYTFATREENTGANSDSSSTGQSQTGQDTDAGDNADGREDYISFQTLTVDGASVRGGVSNQTTAFSFIDEVKINGNAEYIVTLDVGGTQKIDTKTIELAIGDNTVYVIEMVDDEKTTVYTVVIRRRPMYTVSFDSNGVEFFTQTVEEDRFISSPIDKPTRQGYNFKGWNYNFTQPIVQNTAISAKWEVINYTIEYEMASDVQCPQTTSYTIESGATLETPFAPDGYVFYAWSMDGKIVEEIPVGEYGNKKLLAEWRKSEPYTIQGENVYFGEYPQTIKASDVTVSTIIDSRGYYLGSDNAYYAKVTARPCISGYTFSDDTQVTWGNVYYFKVEPIKWRKINEKNGEVLLLCDTVLINQNYDASLNNYKESDIRAWLNGDFYDVAFSTAQRTIIETTTVDNSAESTGYNPNDFACEDTQDNVFILSYDELTSSKYGLDSLTRRQLTTSDYSRATGAEMSKSDANYGAGTWWLRSPVSSYNGGARFVKGDGTISNGSTYSYERGVAPALKIRI